MGYKANGITVIDADGHVLDSSPEVKWEKYLPEKFQHLGPKQIPFDIGGVPVWLDGGLITHISPRGRTMVKGQTSWGLHRNRPGMWDSHARMPDMEAAGIDVAVLFGGAVSVNASAIRDPELGAAMCHAYNSWLADYCKPYADRLKGVAALPLQDIELALAELSHAVKQLGCVAVVGPSNSQGKNLFDLSRDPVFGECERLGVPVCCHFASTFGGRIETASTRIKNALGYTAGSHPIEQMLTFADVILNGTFDRHPKLKVGFMEGWSGWVPFWMERLDDHYEKMAENCDAKAKPSDYWASGQMYVGAEGDERTLPHTIDLIGDTQFLYASDYWHFDAGYFDSVKEIWERADLTQTTKRRLLHDNAARFYNLP